jgi:hypothetical protein
VVLLPPPQHRRPFDARAYEAHYIAEPHVAQRGMLKVCVRIDLVVFAHTHPCGCEHACILEIMKDGNDSTLGESERRRDLPACSIRLRRQVEKNVTVAGEQCKLSTHTYVRFH